VVWQFDALSRNELDRARYSRLAQSSVADHGPRRRAHYSQD